MLYEFLNKHGIYDLPERKIPVWDGPESDTPNGGITYSLLNRYLSCKERFRLLVVEGLKSDEWNHRFFFGNCWHLCEELHCQGKDWYEPLFEYAQKECSLYPYQQSQIDKWYNVCNVTFPHYVEYWNNHEDSNEKESLMSEVAFSIPYHLPSKRIVILRGKLDRVDLLKDGIWLYDHKTKSQIVQHQLMKQLTFDMQLMLYMTALTQEQFRLSPRLAEVDMPVRGCIYNVVRRPLSGGAGTIVQYKATKYKPAETKEHYYNRLSDIIRSSPETYFMRWQIPISGKDIVNFQDRCLNPLLEELCNWWDWVKQGDPWREGNSLHRITPYGLYDPLKEGGTSELDNAVMNGSRIGLKVTDNLFPELQEVA